MSESNDSKDSKPKEEIYKMKGIPINAYLDQTGEFRWIPTQCNNEDSFRAMLDVMKKMPDDRRDVWGKRLDHEIMLTRCPIIKNKPELIQAFDEFFAAHDTSKIRSTKPPTGGDNTK